MSHPDPMHDPENERSDDDLLRDELDWRRREDEELAEQERINAYADAMIRADLDAPRYDARGDLTPDGRNLADWQRHIISPQMEQNAAISQRAKERK